MRKRLQALANLKTTLNYTLDQTKTHTGAVTFVVFSYTCDLTLSYLSYVTWLRCRDVSCFRSRSHQLIYRSNVCACVDVSMRAEHHVCILHTARVHVYMHTCVQHAYITDLYIYTIHTSMFSFVHIYVRMCTYIRTYIYVRTYIHTYVCINAYIHTYINEFTHTHVHTYTHKHIHTYTHTCTCILKQSQIPSYSHTRSPIHTCK